MLEGGVGSGTRDERLMKGGLGRTLFGDRLGWGGRRWLSARPRGRASERSEARSFRAEQGKARWLTAQQGEMATRIVKRGE